MYALSWLCCVSDPQHVLSNHESISLIIRYILFIYLYLKQFKHIRMCWNSYFIFPTAAHLVPLAPRLGSVSITFFFLNPSTRLTLPCVFISPSPSQHRTSSQHNQRLQLGEILCTYVVSTESALITSCGHDVSHLSNGMQLVSRATWQGLMGRIARKSLTWVTLMPQRK